MKTLLKVIVASLVCSTNVHAQQVTFSSDSTKTLVRPKVTYTKPVLLKAPKPITHEFDMGFRLNTNGWGIVADYGKVKTRDQKHSDMFHNVMFAQLEFAETKNPREQKIHGVSGKYIYGKTNNLYSLKLGVGYQKMIAGKPDPGSVSLHWVNSLGFSLGLLKPYYVTLAGGDAIKYSDPNLDKFLSRSSVSGSAGFSKGLDELVYVPGGYIRSGIHVDFAPDNKHVVSLETGVSAEFYSQEIELMANEKPSSSFYNLYIAFQFGKRW